MRALEIGREGREVRCSTAGSGRIGLGTGQENEPATLEVRFHSMQKRLKVKDVL